MRPQAFDSVAAGYDRVFTDSGIGRYQRSAVHRFLDRKVLGKTPLSILEIGCGTGEDAAFFAGRGHTVTATDVSTAMLDCTRAKANARGVADRVQTTTLDLRVPEESNLQGRFDLVFSNFGALNCVDSSALAGLASFLLSHTSTGSVVVMVVMPRVCLWESLYFLAKLRPSAAFRRLSRRPVSASVGDDGIDTWYHSPQAVLRAFEPEYRKNSAVPIGLAIPPSFLDGWADRNPRVLKFLADIDNLARPLGSLAAISDHALIELERR